MADQHPLSFYADKYKAIEGRKIQLKEWLTDDKYMDLSYPQLSDQQKEELENAKRILT